MTAAVIRVSPRQYRLVAERLLTLGDASRRVVTTLLEHVLDTEIATGAALRHLYEHAGEHVVPPPPLAPRPAADGALVIACEDACALLAAPAVLGLLLENGPLATVEVRDISAPELLHGLAVSGIRHGAHVRVQVTGPAWAVAVRGEAEPAFAGEAERLAGGTERLAAERAGVPVPAELWIAACRLSSLPLSAVTLRSRPAAPDAGRPPARSPVMEQHPS